MGAWRVPVAVVVGLVVLAAAGGQVVAAIGGSGENELLSASDCPDATKAFENAGVEAPTAHESCPAPSEIDGMVSQLELMSERRAALEARLGETEEP